MQENAVLRASVNGKPMSVRESFYDFMIENTLTEEPQQEAEVLGNVLGEYEPGIGDGWLAHRIEAGIRKGTVRIAKDDARNKGGDSMIRRGVTEDLAAVAGIQYTFER